MAVIFGVIHVSSEQNAAILSRGEYLYLTVGRARLEL